MLGRLAGAEGSTLEYPSRNEHFFHSLSSEPIKKESAAPHAPEPSAILAQSSEWL